MTVGFVQNTYTRLIAPGVAGTPFDMNPEFFESVANGDVVNIDFGIAVVRSGTDNNGVLPTMSGQQFLGITVRDLQRENLVVGGATTAYLPGDTMSVMTVVGQILVFAEVDVNQGDPVYFRYAANGPLTTLGAFRNDADVTLSVAHAQLIPGATWNTTASAGQVAVIRLPKIS